ncbi:zinc-dependent alcohol dehydrogenase [Pseudarthrobacter siccitolerans]
MSKAVGLVQVDARRCELQEFDFPVLTEGAVLVRVEANGLCASDIDAYNGIDSYWDGRPRILGHEIVGVIEDMGPKSKPRDVFNIGDRVAVNPFVVCGVCDACLRGDQQGCNGTRVRLRYGAVPTEVEPSLWGGYATHVYVPPNGILYKVPERVSALDATLWNPISGGYEWGVVQGGIEPGHKVLILGPGQRGLAATFPIRQAGASQIVVTGLDRDSFKLDLALEVGADAVINVEKENLVERANELTGGTGFDVVIDTTPHATKPIVDAIDVVSRNGTIVVIGLKNRNLDGFPIDRLLYKRARIQGWVGQSHDSYLRAIDLIASGQYPVHKLRTHVFGFDQLDKAVNVLSGDVPGEKAVNVVLAPPAA